MSKSLIVLIFAVALFTSCKKSPSPSAQSGDPVQQKLQELAGKGATDCGRLKSQAEDQMKTASACALQAAQGKHPFFVAYDLPGMTIAVAGDSEGKLYSVQSEQPENAPPSAKAELKMSPCPSELRIAQSGRVTCYAPGSFGSMGSMGGASPHGGMSMPPGMGSNPHGGMTMPPMTPSNPHGDGSSAAPKHQ